MNFRTGRLSAQTGLGLTLALASWVGLIFPILAGSPSRSNAMPIENNLGPILEILVTWFVTGLILIAFDAFRRKAALSQILWWIAVFSYAVVFAFLLASLLFAVQLTFVPTIGQIGFLAEIWTATVVPIVYVISFSLRAFWTFWTIWPKK